MTERKIALRPILESARGIHLTAYLSNGGDLLDVTAQLRQTIREAAEDLREVQSREELLRFLEPLGALLGDTRLLKEMKGNIGIFRSEDSFRLLSIPVPVPRGCQIATTFHVKPLLRWLQSDEEFLFLGLEDGIAHLYLGSQSSFRLLESVPLAGLPPEGGGTGGSEPFCWLRERLAKLTRVSKPRLFVAGEPARIPPVLRSLRYKNAVKAPVSRFFNRVMAVRLCQSIRRILRDESRQNLEKALGEFRRAETDNRARRNIFEISRAVVQGRVRKLVVADDFSIFGKIDPGSGGLSIHPVDLDHEDDCILDDLAQMVFNQGGEVTIAKRDEIPGGRPILAIFNGEREGLVKRETFQSEVLRERFG